jgi:uncharacterized protein (TIGR02001 family)
MNKRTAKTENHGSLRALSALSKRARTAVALLAITVANVSPMTAQAQEAPLTQQLETSMPAAAPIVVKTPSAAPAAEVASTFDAKFSAGVTSDYNYRGYTLSNHLPSVFANVEADYNILFASVNVASVEMPDLSHFQMTDTVGLRRTFGKLTVETGGAIYSYPGGANDPSYAEVYVSPTYAVMEKFTVGLNVFYAPDYYRMGAWENYNSFTAKYDIGWGLFFSAELGRQSFGTTRATATSPAVALPDYTYGNAGFSYTYKSLTFDLRYHATTLSKQSCFLITATGSAAGGSNGCDQTVIATLSWNAGLSDVKSALTGSK